MQLNLKPSHAKVREYYSALNQYGQLNISHETAVREAFASLLDSCARQFQWKLVHEFRVPAPRNKYVTVDGAVLDSFTLKHGYWEAKALEDNLEKEIKKKLDLGYPRNNIIFQSPEKAILYQRGIRQGLNEDISGIPKEVYDYRLGNRSALEWVIDQYQVSTDQRSGITNDPNRDDDPEYILRLIGQVITVSLETVKLVSGLPGLGLPQQEKAAQASAPIQ